MPTVRKLPTSLRGPHTPVPPSPSPSLTHPCIIALSRAPIAANHPSITRVHMHTQRARGPWSLHPRAASSCNHCQFDGLRADGGGCPEILELSVPSTAPNPGSAGLPELKSEESGLRPTGRAWMPGHPASS